MQDYKVTIKVKKQYNQEYTELFLIVMADNIENGKINTHNILKNLFTKETTYYIDYITEQN